MLSAEGLAIWLIKEVVLFCILMIALWGVGKMGIEEGLAKWVRVILIAIIGGVMFVLLLRLVGVF